MRVHYHGAFRFRTGRLGNGEVGAHAAGKHDQVRGELFAALEANAFHVFRAQNALALRPAEDFHPGLPRNVHEHGGRFLVQLAHHGPLGRFQHRHPASLLPQSPCGFQAQHAAADDHGALRAAVQPATDGADVPQAADGDRAGHGGAGDGRNKALRAQRIYAAVIVQARAAVQPDLLRIGIKPLHPAARQQQDALTLKPCGLPEVQRFFRGPERFGEHGAGIGRRIFIGHQDNGAGSVAFPDGFGGGERGGTAAQHEKDFLGIAAERDVFRRDGDKLFGACATDGADGFFGAEDGAADETFDHGLHRHTSVFLTSRHGTAAL